MKKSDLENKMLVQLRSGEICIVIDDVLIGNDYYYYLEEYTEDLLYDDGLIGTKKENWNDIVLVSEKLALTDSVISNWTTETLIRNLKWERPKEEQQKEYTMKELFEKIGHEFKIKG